MRPAQTLHPIELAVPDIDVREQYVRMVLGDEIEGLPRIRRLANQCDTYPGE